AIGNRVVYYNVSMPQKVEGAVIQGGATQVVRGMPFTLKVTPVSVDARITLSVNGINKVVDAAVANLSIPAVVEDLEISIQVNPKGSDAYTVVNVKEGELDAKIAQCPARLKVIGVMRSEDFDAFRKHSSTIVELDLADVTIKGAGDLANAIPSKAFASTTGFVQSALQSIILPTNLVNIEENAFYRCVSLSEVTIPASVTYVGANAFSSCARLSKIVTLATAPPATGNMSPFPANTANITLEVPNGAESHYSAATFWNELNMSTSKVYYKIQIDPERSFNYNTYYQLNKIDVSNDAAKVTI
ncbi:MAG: leucine-rich repeat domain-containing protein, partial [Duncaniella sp.]|nr:leucine-rich repeat domain-containing protein [Duncaniella sp.]